jgi:hypothetical protein
MHTVTPVKDPFVTAAKSQRRSLSRSTAGGYSVQARSWRDEHYSVLLGPFLGPYLARSDAVLGPTRSYSVRARCMCSVHLPPVCKTGEGRIHKDASGEGRRLPPLDHGTSCYGR